MTTILNRDYLETGMEIMNQYIWRETGNDVFWLNVRAECDIIRDDDPALYLIKGKVLNVSDLTGLPRIKMKASNSGSVLIIDGQEYATEELRSYDKAKRGAFNKQLQEVEGKLLFKDGEIIQKKTHTLISCIAGKYVMEFSFKDFKVENKSILETYSERIGRVIPPYINKVQNEFSSFIVRQGIMPIPDKLVLSNNQ